MNWTNDPVRDAEIYAAEQDRQLDRLPVCADCGEPVQADHYYEINDEVICPACIEAYRKEVEDYIE